LLSNQCLSNKCVCVTEFCTAFDYSELIRPRQFKNQHLLGVGAWAAVAGL
jgi:hypothetical protein